MSLSESALKKLSKNKVTTVTLECQENVDSTSANINKEIPDLWPDHDKTQSELCVSRKSEVVSLKRQYSSNYKYSRRECLDLSGLHSVENLKLGDTAFKLFKTLNVEIGSSSIED